MEKTVHLLIMYTMLVLTVLLFHKGRKHPRSLMLAIYALVEVITNGLNSLNIAAGIDFYTSFPFMHFIYKPLYCLWVPLFYFYFKYCYSHEFKLSKKHLFHFLPFIFYLISFLLIWIIIGNQHLGATLYVRNTLVSNAAYAVDITVNIQYIIYNFLMIRALLILEKERRIQKPATDFQAVDIKWLRFIVYGYAVGAIGGIGIFVFALLKNPAVITISMVSISYFFLFFFGIFYNTITHEISIDEIKLQVEEINSKLKTLPDADLHRLMNRIDEVVAGKQMYLDPELSLQKIASSLNEKERIISQAINTIQKRNVNDYVNSLRIEHACGLLVTDKEKPIFEIMYESGFNTKWAFNQAFKKVTGKTPTQFKCQ